MTVASPNRPSPRFAVPVLLARSLAALLLFAFPSSAGAATAVLPGVVPATPAMATKSAVVHFGDLARQQRLAREKGLPPVRVLLRDEEEEGEGRMQNETGEPGAGITGLDLFATPPPFTLDVASPSPTSSFAGLDDIPMADSNYIVIPPDVGGAVGPTRIFQGSNNNYRILDKATGAVLQTLGTATFWAPVVPTANLLDLTDPRTLYDPYNDRFIAVMQTYSASGLILVGVSQTSDPAGAWNLFAYNTGSSIDFPTVGFNKNWIVVAINRYSAGGTFQRGITLVADYPSARAGSGIGTIFTQAANTHFCSAPAVTYSATSESLYVITHLSSAGATYQFDVISGTPGSPVYTAGGSQVRTGGGWVQPSGNLLPQSAPNAGSSACGATPCPMETQDSQVRSAPVYRDGFFYYAQTVGLPAAGLQHTGAQWTKLTTPGGSFVEGGRIEDPTATSNNGGKWYADVHLGVNANHDVMVGYTQFSSAQHPAAGYSMHLAGDAAGSMRDVVIAHAGEDYYHKTFSTATGRNRWGDYSTVQVDPVDDMTLWSVQEYGKTRVGTDDGNGGANGSRWATWWAAVAPPNATIDAGPSLAEGNGGTTAFQFTARLSSTYGLPVTVNYHTVDGTATAADNDYQSVSSSVIIPAGSLTANFTVDVNGDTQCEGDQTFDVVLDSANHNIALGATTSATGTILNDETGIDITASADAGGTISPSGVVAVGCGVNQQFDIVADSCHIVADVLVDGLSQGAITTYTFTAPTEAHTISATFAERITLGENHVDASCNGGANGSIDLTVTGAAAPVGYSWSNGETTEDLSGLMAGSYTVTVTDANGCVKQLTVDIEEASSIALGESHADACTNADDGSIDLSVSGGTPGYTFSWSNGETTEDLSGLAPGDYTVTVTDNAGCDKQLLVSVGVRQYVITPSAGANGAISPDVATPVDCGTVQKFSITPDPGYTIDQLLVDGSPVAATNSYSFPDVQATHTIDVTFTATTAVAGGVPVEFALGPVTPNPVRADMQVAFGLPSAARVRVSVIDLQGRELSVLLDSEAGAGWHYASWNGRSGRREVGAGVYFVRYQVGGRTFMRKFAMMR